ncbi:predicted protein [Uncinocarpus reesii 1704]|uniref:HypA protein n=1 Tax=Uncinocarpus reesii (strain UAMH 1704) TaxID=336963 RepID=C4JM50_UNCRE|nr:uncharacterized protein UREG_03908 [Uncinocarpus reesii 1704]EEP79062.1 predicted protein [Uncinocarpus reesii 1704]
MATARSVKLSTEDSGVFRCNPRADSASKASQLLQEDMKVHNIFFNDSGFHNHTAHHLLSLFALGASPEDMQAAYRRAAEYQRPARPANEEIVKKLSNRDEFKALAGKREEYPHFLEFFQREIDAKGVEAVVDEYIFKGDEFADDMLAGGVGHSGEKTLVELQNDCRADPRLRDSAHWADSNKIFDGVLKRAPEEMMKVASQFTVGPDQIDQRLAELINAVAYYTGAAQNPPKRVKFDFFYIHCVNSSIFLPVFVSQPWISQHNKQRLLEWKGRMDLLVYVSRHCAEPRFDEITNYKPVKTWEETFAAAFANREEDGHAVKLLRTLAYGEKVCKPYENKNGFPVKGDMWLKLANMVADSIQGPGELWIRSTGFPEAWKDVPDRARL